MTSLVTMEKVTCSYGGRPVLVNVDLAVESGEFVGIVGPSGSGKTTLLRAITGTVRPVAGVVRTMAGLTLGHVPQVETVNWHFPVTVGQVVLMSRSRGRILPWASRQEKAEVQALLDRLGIGELAERHILELSGGQQQRVFLARALLSKPDLVLLDEPTSGVDVRTRHDILHLLLDLNADGLAVALTTHDLNGVATHLPKLVCLNQEVIASGSPAQVITPDVLERTYGAPLEVLEHGGTRIVVDSFQNGGPAGLGSTGIAGRPQDSGEPRGLASYRGPAGSMAIGDAGPGLAAPLTETTKRRAADAAPPIPPESSAGRVVPFRTRESG